MKKLTDESMNITEENLKAMQQLFPEAFEEGKIDFDVLRQLLGDFVDDEQERYSFKWNGKGKALRLSQTPSMGTLRPCKEESKDWDNTENLYIEGDNLEVLKLLQKSYYGKVKMIYIDPPYNTGGDFVYKDNFRDNIQNYKEVTGQVDGEGNKIDTNTESNGRFHTDWLNMIYPRLRLARNLLTDDGFIFMSIDDNEVEDLIRVSDEVYGQNNRVAILVWKKKYTGGKGTSTFADYHEYILAYAKDSNKIGEISMARPESEKDKFNQMDEYFKERGKYYTRPLKSNLDPRPTLVYPIELPDGNTVITQWICAKDTYEKMLEEGRIEFKDSTHSKYPVYKKFYEKDGGGNIKIPSFLEVSNNNEAKEELKEIFDIAQTRDLPFLTPKPIKLLNLFVENFTTKDDVVIDFFSGSSSTAHAVIKLNAEDGGHRKFIMVQLPEPTDKKSEAYKAGYKNICEIGKERIRRAGEKIKAEAGDRAADLDIGFKVFKLDSSNLQKWNPQPDDLVMTLQQAMDNFLPDRTEQDVLYEIMLKMGLELTCQIEEEQAAGETVYIIGGGALMICLGHNITTAVAEAVVKLHEEYESELWQVVFRDTGFASDMDKTNVKETLKAAGLDEDSFVCV